MMQRNIAVSAALTLILFAGALPLFFDVYRIAVFKAVSYDDYAPYLLWLLDLPGGSIPQSPHAYRLGSILLSAPFFHLPLVEFTGARLPLLYQQATQAVCLANVFYVSVSALLMSCYLHLQRGVALEWAALAGFAALLLARYQGLNNVDGIASPLLLLIVLSALERRVTWFCLFSLLGLFVNEKTVVVGGLLVFFRLLFEPEHRRSWFVMTIAAFGTLVLYLATVKLVAIPGNEYQTSPGTYLGSALGMVGLSLDAKGLFINVWPVLFLLTLWAIGTTAPSRDRIILRCDVGVLAGLTAMSFLLDVKYAVGRIDMYVLPLYLMGATQALSLAGSRVAVPVAGSSPTAPTLHSEPSSGAAGRSL